MRSNAPRISSAMDPVSIGLCLLVLLLVAPHLFAIGRGSKQSLRGPAGRHASKQARRRSGFISAAHTLRTARKRIKQGEPASAIELLDGLRDERLQADDADAERCIRMMALYHLARFDDAIETGTHVLETSTFVWARTEATIRYYLARAHQARGELGTALDLLKQVTSGDHAGRARELIPDLVRQVHGNAGQDGLARRSRSTSEPPKLAQDRTPLPGAELGAGPESPGFVAIGPGAHIDKYVIESEIGQGGMALVFKVRHTALGSHHAMKILAPDLVRNEAIRRRFLAEGQIQARLRHPNIVPVTDLVAVPGVAALVMDYVDGLDLHAHIERLAVPPEAASVRSLFVQILAAVGHAHDAGVIHRDLKPSNVLMERPNSEAPRAFVLDFGIAKITDGRKGLTRTRAVLGTPAYMSPEQIRGARDVTGQSDIFSLGVMLYEFATLSEPFGGDSDFEIQSRIVQGEFSPAWERCPTVDRGISLAIERALAVDPSQRFTSCAEFAAALTAPV